MLVEVMMGFGGSPRFEDLARRVRGGIGKGKKVMDWEVESRRYFAGLDDRVWESRLWK